MARQQPKKPVSVGGIALGMDQAAARERLAESPYLETRPHSDLPGQEIDVASSHWNAEACVPTRSTVTKAACSRTAVTYSLPALGPRVLRVARTQTLKPSLATADVRDRLTERHGLPDSEVTETAGLFRRPVHLTLTWGPESGEAGQHLVARLFFDDGDDDLVKALTLEAVDLGLMAQNSAELDKNGTKTPGSGDEQLDF